MPALVGTVYENLDIVHLQIEGGNNEVKQYMLTTDTSRQTMFSLSENGELPIYRNKSKIKRAIASLKNINDLNTKELPKGRIRRIEVLQIIPKQRTEYHRNHHGVIDLLLMLREII